MAEYHGAARAGLSPNRDPRAHKIQLFIVHHYASTQSPEDAWRRFNAPNDRSVSPNYQVNADGSVFEVVPPKKYRAWTTGAIDHRAITCETQNTSMGPTWGISKASLEAIAQLVAWAHRTYGIPLQRGRVNSDNTVAVAGIVGHNETPAGKQTATLCPGPSMDIPWIISRAKQIVAGKKPAPTPATEPSSQEDDDMLKPTVHARLTDGKQTEWMLGHPDIGAGLPIFEGTATDKHRRPLSDVTIFRGFMVTTDPKVFTAWARTYGRGTSQITSVTDRDGYVEIQKQLSRVATELGS